MRLFYKSLYRSLALIVQLICLVVYKTSAQANAPFDVPQHWRNTNMLRTVDLTSPIVRVATAVAAQNIHNESIGEYYYPIPEGWNEHLSYIEAKERKSEQPFEVEKAEFDSSKWVLSNQTSQQFEDMFVMQYSNETNKVTCGKSKKFKWALRLNDTSSLMNNNCRQIQYYKIFFNRPLGPKEKIKFTITTTFTHVLTPYPKEVGQTEKQNILFRGNQYGNSAYHTDQQKTQVKLPSVDVISYSQPTGFVTSNRNMLEYGLFDGKEPNSYEELKIHYEFQQGILTIKSLRRDLEVSHWGGNLAVEEHFDLTHDGARLKGHYSRLELHKSIYRSQDSIMVRDLSLDLPVHASDIYYRDEIGNVSTSRLFYERDKVVLALRPRYPLFGGWNYTWYHGYNVPLGDFMRYHTESDRYILNVPFFDAFPQVTYDKVQVRIILPEGARDVKVETPFSIDKESHGIHKTYLDTIGRCIVVLDKFNVVNDHSKNIQISYAYNAFELMRKPLIVSTFLLGAFLLSMVYSRIEFGIGKSKKKNN